MLSVSPFKEKAASWGVWLIGTAFAAAAVLKALDIESFSEQIALYQLIPPSLSLPGAVLIILLEATLGFLCISGIEARKALWGVFSLLIVFTAATAFRWSLLEGSDCNCFGLALPGGPAAVLWRNALLIPVVSALILWAPPGAAARPPRRLRTFSGVPLALILALFLQGFFAASPFSIDPEDGEQLRIFLSATCTTCRDSAESLHELVRGYKGGSVKVFIAARHQQEIDDFLEAGKLQIDYVPVTQSQVATQVKFFPVVRLLRDGGIVQEWSAELPTLQEVEKASRGQSRPRTPAGS
ncbi:MAG: MauE/DoxX family redox-associated membrane protein [Acidobacteriota bacterium]